MMPILPVADSPVLVYLETFKDSLLAVNSSLSFAAFSTPVLIAVKELESVAVILGSNVPVYLAM